MEVVETADAAEFRAVTEEFLLRHEAANNLILGVSGVARDRPGWIERFRGWIVADGDEVVGAAAQVPPSPLILTYGSGAAVYERLADVVHDVPGVVGAQPGVAFFVSQRPETVARTMNQGIFQLTSVTAPPNVDGTSRPATEEDSNLLIRWLTRFESEALGKASDNDHIRRVVANRLEPPHDASGFWLFEVEGSPVSMSGYSGPTPNGIRLGGVFTPPGQRGKGYASNLVAEQSQWLLDQGRKFCFLHTDLANPTSNTIYERIGYRRVVESADCRFG